MTPKTICAIPEEILNRKYENNKKMYLVKWVPKSGGNCTWEPSENIEGFRDDLVERYDMMQRMDLMSFEQKIAYGITRVSTRGQIDSRYIQGHSSLESQEQEIRNCCKEKKWTLKEIGSEVKSGKNAKKLKSLNYILDIAIPGSVIVFYDVSRFLRDFAGGVLLLDGIVKEKKLILYSILDNAYYEGAAGRHIFRGLLAAAAFFSEQLSEKVLRSVARRKVEGYKFGPVPFGMSAQFDSKKVRQFVEDKNEQKILRFIQKQAEKSLNDAAIVDILKRKNITVRGKLPSTTFVKGVCKRYRYR